jgi:hypothetical protein
MECTLTVPAIQNHAETADSGVETPYPTQGARPSCPRPMAHTGDWARQLEWLMLIWNTVLVQNTGAGKSDNASR